MNIIAFPDPQTEEPRQTVLIMVAHDLAEKTLLPMGDSNTAKLKKLAEEFLHQLNGNEPPTPTKKSDERTYLRRDYEYPHS